MPCLMAKITTDYVAPANKVHIYLGGQLVGAAPFPEGDDGWSQRIRYGRSGSLSGRQHGLDW